MGGKKLNSPNVHEHIDKHGDSQVCHTVYPLCPVKQFSIAFFSEQTTVNIRIICQMSNAAISTDKRDKIQEINTT